MSTTNTLGRTADQARHPRPKPTVARGAPCHTTGIIGQLNAEWRRLCAHPDTARHLASWKDQCPHLGTVDQLADIEVFTRGLARDQADQILLTLLRHARTGDQMAGRTVLQLMLGKAVRIAATRRSRRETPDEVTHIAVAALWQAIASYPLERRPAKVAANLAMETLHRVVAEAPVDFPTEQPLTEIGAGSRQAGGGVLRQPTGLAGPGSEEPDSWRLLEELENGGRLPVGHSRATSSTDEILEVLAWGVGHQVISTGEATLLADVYCPMPGFSGGQSAAATHGISRAAARQRCRRAIRRLADAVVDYSPTRDLIQA